MTPGTHASRYEMKLHADLLDECGNPYDANTYIALHDLERYVDPISTRADIGYASDQLRWVALTMADGS